MKLIRQKPGTSTCGPCVVAMLTGREYVAVESVMGSGRNYPRDIRKALQYFDYDFTATKSIPLVMSELAAVSGIPGAVFCFVPVDGREASHWVAWSGKMFFDPLHGKREKLPDDWKCGIYLVKKV